MASWMVHLRIADTLLNQLSSLSPVEFIVGNIAPDSGVPNEDWSVFTPSTTISHFRTPRHKKADPVCFAEKYFTIEQIKTYTAEQKSFYLGYLIHLMTDVAWSNHILYPAKERFADEWAADSNACIWRMKEDWYDLDFMYLRDHPDFRAFRIYRDAIGFENRFMEEFSPDAFDNRRKYITDFYLSGKDNLDRYYPYLTKEAMDSFVAKTSEVIRINLCDEYGIT